MSEAVMLDHPGLEYSDEFDFIDELIERRKATGLSQQDFAKELNVAKSTVTRFETRVGNPKLSTIELYCEALGVCLVVLDIVD
jgi:predicted transcriptional regulator